MLRATREHPSGSAGAVEPLRGALMARGNPAKGRTRPRGGRVPMEALGEIRLLQHLVRRLHELLPAVLGGEIAAHDRSDDLALGAPDADRRAAGVAFPGTGEAPSPTPRSGSAAPSRRRRRDSPAPARSVGRHVARGLDDDRLPLGAGGELDVLPGRLLLRLVGRAMIPAAAAGRQAAGLLVVHRHLCGVEREACRRPGR